VGLDPAEDLPGLYAVGGSGRGLGFLALLASDMWGL